jgi:hypothetical protein
MPEEQFAFKPDPAVRSFGQILGHVADANYTFCAGVLGESSPAPEIEDQNDSGTDGRAAQCFRLLRPGLRCAHGRQCE